MHGEAPDAGEDREAPSMAERLEGLEALVAQADPLRRDLEVIHLQLTRAEGKLARGNRDVRSELRIVEQRLARAEARLRRATPWSLDTPWSIDLP